MPPSATTNPEVGMLATVRNRRGVVSGVRLFDGPQGRLHLVDIEYNDGETPFEESLLWERELDGNLISATTLPQVDLNEPMLASDLLAIIRACRWSAHMPYIDPDGAGPLDRLPVSAPFHGAIQVEDFQLVPLLKALRMPRVSMLIADDVGLGKTVEAGLILSELLIRRRIRKVLIMTPASLRLQWREELEEKFSLPFEVVDRNSTLSLRRQFGMDANPWRMHSRIITSYYYLKQADVLEEFRAASRSKPGAAHLPWDLLIVDEAHNLAPAPLGEDSDLTKMLRQVAPRFEHRIFLTATPHNGHTRSFTGLLEVLDPVRFSQTSDLSQKERERVPDVLVRRLKREINARTTPPPFCERHAPAAINLDLSGEERSLSAAFDEIRSKIHSVLARHERGKRVAGSFAVEILGKRLLSCPVAFADSWWRCREGLELEQEATESEVRAAKRSVEEETADDREAESRARAASSTVGAWLRALAPQMEPEIAAIDRGVDGLGLGREATSSGEVNPSSDSRYAAFKNLIEDRLRAGGDWLADERIVVFTEYKTTLDYLIRRLREDYPEEERTLSLYGGMGDDEREHIKQAFNDPDHLVRILVATDAASEGLNLQETARYLLHWDIPWNPARLEQRNGRLDRHGQARDVLTWHFASEEDQDLRFLSHVANKVHTIREDLGITGEVLDQLIQRRLIEGDNAEQVQLALNEAVDRLQREVDVPRDSDVSTSEEVPDAQNALRGLHALEAEIDLSPQALADTLDTALGISLGRPRIEPISDDPQRLRLVHPYPPTWQGLIDEWIRSPRSSTNSSAVRALTFDPSTFIEMAGSHPVFKPRPDTVLLHLGHPVLRRAILSLARRRFPGTNEASRWSARVGGVPEGVDGIVELTVEELAVNDLRETFHHWVRTLRYPIQEGRLGEPLPHLPAAALRAGNGALKPSPEVIKRIGRLWGDIEDDLEEALEQHRETLAKEVSAQLATDREGALSDETQRYRSRHGEISALIEESTLKRLEREIDELQRRRQQLHLSYAEYRAEEIERDIEQKKEELKRRKQHYEDVREELEQERKRIVETVIPHRFSLRGELQVLPLAVEVVLPEAEE